MLFWHENSIVGFTWLNVEVVLNNFSDEYSCGHAAIDCCLTVMELNSSLDYTSVVTSAVWLYQPDDSYNSCKLKSVLKYLKSAMPLTAAGVKKTSSG